MQTLFLFIVNLTKYVCHEWQYTDMQEPVSIDKTRMAIHYETRIFL
jgi:hypothetical protein